MEREGLDEADRPFAAPASSQPRAYAWSPSSSPILAVSRPVDGLTFRFAYGRVGSIGLLVAGAVLIGIASFLNWYELTTPGGFPVGGGGGMDNGGAGVWTLAMAAFAIVDAVALWSARQDWAISLCLRALWLDAAILVYNAASAFYNVANGQWHTIGTNLALTASPGPGLMLLAVGLAALLLAVVRISLLVRRREWLVAR